MVGTGRSNASDNNLVYLNFLKFKYSYKFFHERKHQKKETDKICWKKVTQCEIEILTGLFF